MKLSYFKSMIPAMSFAFMVSMASCANDLDISPIDPSVNLDFSQDEVFAKLYATMALTGQEGPAGDGDVSGIDEGTSA
ncbi:RagB/SusD family nutrient uptake outer membrane protein, partial [termite gut metagenome]